MHIPRIIISGLSGGAGKTLLSLGLARAFARRMSPVRAFKKGPDYIDAAWLSKAAGTPQGTLDPFFTPAEDLRARFRQEAAGCALALVEGNRGLFDGLDLTGSCSTAELSRILNAPVLLVLDCTKMTRTAAALVKGCRDFEPGLHIGGVLLNRTGNPRHQALVRQAVEELAGVPVLGVLPRNPDIHIPERHMGLVGLDENDNADAYLENLADFVAAHTDLEAIAALARAAPPLPEDGNAQSGLSAAPPRDAQAATAQKRHAPSTRPVIGYVRDAAFWFYYRENLEALENAGARLIPLSLLRNDPWPEIDGLYIGGGLPELHLPRLSANIRIREHVAGLCRAGLPVYAECGGFMYLTESIHQQERVFPMAGVFPCAVALCERPQGLGYVEAEVTAANPFFPRGLRFRGHEFHFSRCLPGRNALLSNTGHILRLHKGRGMAASPEGEGVDGLVAHNTFAAYTHIYAPALAIWAPAFVALCRKN